MRAVKVSDATLNTITVSLTALTVNNKQMTLSVFRQLPRMSNWLDIDAQGTLIRAKELGVLWGLVRYPCEALFNPLTHGMHKPEEWIVGAYSGELFRAPNLRAEYAIAEVRRLYMCTDCPWDTTLWRIEDARSLHNREIAPLPQLFIAV
jgi:hypothetical protein